MTRRCPKCGCSAERLPEQESNAAEQIVDAYIDGVSSAMVLIEFVRRLWPWSQRNCWCPRCRKVVTR
jgi:hypothetical protein